MNGHRTIGPWVAVETNNGTYVKSEATPGYLIEVRHVRGGQDVKADAQWIAQALNAAERKGE